MEGFSFVGFFFFHFGMQFMLRKNFISFGFVCLWKKKKKPEGEEELLSIYGFFFIFIFLVVVGVCFVFLGSQNSIR